jgi:ABC-2 type transport system ATP-binding protein
VGIVEAGRLVAQGSLEEMQRRVLPHRRLKITLLAQGEEARLALREAGREGVLEVRVPEAPSGNGNGAHPVVEVDFTGSDEAVSALLKDLVARGLPVLHFTESMHDVEDVFMQVTKGIVS